MFGGASAAGPAPPWSGNGICASQPPVLLKRCSVEVKVSFGGLTRLSLILSTPMT